MGKIVNKIRQARLAYQVKQGRPISMQEIADAIGVTRAYLNNIELGKAWPNEDVLAALCKLYGVQPGDLLSYEDWLARHTAMAGTLHSVTG
jgi:transcriptional regulator with XRE-family HTH domain